MGIVPSEDLFLTGLVYHLRCDVPPLSSSLPSYMYKNGTWQPGSVAKASVPMGRNGRDVSLGPGMVADQDPWLPRLGWEIDRPPCRWSCIRILRTNEGYIIAEGVTSWQFILSLSLNPNDLQ